MCVLLGLDTALLQLLIRKATGSSEPAVDCKEADEEGGPSSEVEKKATDHDVSPCEK